MRLKYALSVLFLSFICFYSFLFAQETLTITTYYPSPYGSYNELRLVPHNPAVAPCNATFGIGTMFYDNTTNPPQLKICDGTSWQVIGGVAPSGMIAMFNSACPGGWTYLSGFENKFPRGSSVYGATGGSDTHSHTAGTLAAPSHSHTSAIAGFGGAGGGGWDGRLQPNNAGNAAYATAAPQTGLSGAGSVTGSTAAASNVPSYINVIFCLKD